MDKDWLKRLRSVFAVGKPNWELVPNEFVFLEVGDVENVLNPDKREKAPV